jgi:competence protein ComEC
MKIHPQEEPMIRCSVTSVLILTILIALACASPALSLGKLSVSVIDVGQGDSILVQFPDGKDMLVDAGDSSHGQTVVNYLHACKVPRIDILVATHPHEDHIGGMADILTTFQIGKVWDSGYNQGSRVQRQFLTTIKAKGIRFGTPKAGFLERIGDAEIKVLAPNQLMSGTDSDANNNSIVMRIVYGKISFLLTGDMEGDERGTISQWPACTVLKVAHHGSRNGTDSAFLGAVSPKIDIISVASHNDYGHPHSEALARGASHESLC